MSNTDLRTMQHIADMLTMAHGLCPSRAMQFERGLITFDELEAFVNDANTEAYSVAAVTTEIENGVFAPLHVECFNSFGDAGEHCRFALPCDLKCDLCGELLTDAPKVFTYEEFEAKCETMQRDEFYTTQTVTFN